MVEVLVVYATDHGATEKMAKVFAGGVARVADCQPRLLKAEEARADDLLAADAIVLGTPVHMASMDWRIKKFIDDVCGGLWMQDRLVGKVGAVFACGSGYGNAGGGCELTMLAMLDNLAELGLVLVPLPRNTPGYMKGGLQWGPYGRAHNEDVSPIQGGLPDERVEAAGHHGEHVAKVAKALAGGDHFA